MVSEVERLLGARAGENTAINAAVLFRMGLHRACDLVLFVDAPALHRFCRAKRRDRLPARHILRRFRRQRDIRKRELNKLELGVDIQRVRNPNGRALLREDIERSLRSQGLAV
jgi:dephospho-CoA kinase